MIFVTGPLFAGKKEYVCQALGWSEEDLSAKAAWDVQDLAAQAEDLEAMDPAQRVAREAAGRLACLLAQRAETVIRVCCGLPQALKGELL